MLWSTFSPLSLSSKESCICREVELQSKRGSRNERSSLKMDRKGDKSDNETETETEDKTQITLMISDKEEMIKER